MKMFFWKRTFSKFFFFFYLALMLNKKEIETIIIHQDKLKKIIGTIKKKINYYSVKHRN